MARAFTQYWKNTTWADHDPGMDTLDHTASNEFRTNNVRRDDRIFIVTNIGGVMYVGGVLSVDKIVGQREATKKFDAEVWQAKDHAMGRGGQPFYKKLRVPVRIARARGI